MTKYNHSADSSTADNRTPEPDLSPPKFQCLQCGKCCSHIRGKMTEEEYALIKSLGYGGLPMVQLVPPEKLSFPIWPDEARRLNKKAVSLGLKPGIDVRIIPLRVVFDLSTNTSIIITYLFDHDDCPFQKMILENSEEHTASVKQNIAPCAECIAYDSRTLICRQFPFQTPNEIVEWCSGIEKLNQELKAIGKTVAALSPEEKQFVFGDAYSAALEMNQRMESVHKKIFELIKSKKIRPAINYPYKFLIRRIEKSRMIDLDGFE